MKKSIKITTLAFAATLSTISAATAAGVLCSNHFTQQNVDSINKQVYLDTVAPVSNGLSNTTGGALVKPTLNNTPVASYEGNQQSTTNVKPTLDSTPTSSQTSIAPVTTPVQSDTSSNVTNQEVESSVESSDSSSDQQSLYSKFVQNIFDKVNVRVEGWRQSGNNFKIGLKGINGANFNSGYNSDDLYNTELRLFRVSVPYVFRLTRGENGCFTGNVYANYFYDKTEVELLEDVKLINDCKTVDQQFDYFDGPSYCYNLYNKAGYRTISHTSNELIFNINLAPVHTPDVLNSAYQYQGKWYNLQTFWTSGYVIIPKCWDNSIYKLANSRTPIDFKELISYGVKQSLLASSDESRGIPDVISRLMIRHNDGNENNDPINHWNSRFDQKVKEEVNKIINQQKNNK